MGSLQMSMYNVSYIYVEYINIEFYAQNKHKEEKNWFQCFFYIKDFLAKGKTYDCFTDNKVKGGGGCTFS